MIVARSVNYLCRSLGRRLFSPTPISSFQTQIRRYRAVRSSSESSPPNRDSARSAPIPIATQSEGIVRSINFCRWCGETKREVPDGEEKLMAICTLCDKIAYQNPKMVVGCLIKHDEKVVT